MTVLFAVAMAVDDDALSNAIPCFFRIVVLGYHLEIIG